MKEHKITRSLVGATLLLLVLHSNVFSDEPDEKLHKECLYPTVGIGSECNLYQRTFEGKSPAYGSGVIVRSEKHKDHYHNVVISCEHVITGRHEVKVRVGQYKDWSTFVDWKDYPAIIVSHDAELDLSVLLFTSKKKMPVAKLGLDSKLYIGSDVFHIGAGLGDQPRLDYGKVTSVNSKLSLMKRAGIRVNCFMVPGDSGGPLFNSKNEVIGFSQALRSVQSGFGTRFLGNFGFAIPLGRIKDLPGVEYAYDHSKPMPVLDYDFLHAMEYDFSYFPGWQRGK
jgi:S1-C subfamily serine protease